MTNSFEIASLLKEKNKIYEELDSIDLKINFHIEKYIKYFILKTLPHAEYVNMEVNFYDENHSYLAVLVRLANMPFALAVPIHLLDKSIEEAYDIFFRMQKYISNSSPEKMIEILRNDIDGDFFLKLKDEDIVEEKIKPIIMDDYKIEL